MYACVENPSERTDIVAGPSGREVISLQEADSLIVFLNVKGR